MKEARYFSIDVRQEIAILLRFSVLVRQMCAKSRFAEFDFCEYIAKTPVSDKETGVFLVAEVGLEPTTSGL